MVEFRGRTEEVREGCGSCAIAAGSGERYGRVMARGRAIVASSGKVARRRRRERDGRGDGGGERDEDDETRTEGENEDEERDDGETMARTTTTMTRDDNEASTMKLATRRRGGRPRLRLTGR